MWPKNEEISEKLINEEENRGRKMCNQKKYKAS